MITVHHLNNSRSQRVLWLLEELGLPYEVKRYERNARTMLAPPELLVVHPLGKSPVITDGDITVAESGAIVEYLLERYGNGRLVPASGTPEQLRYRYFLHYAEGSVMPLLVMKLVVGAVMRQRMPFFVKPIARRIVDGLNQGFIGPNLTRNLDFMEAELSGRSWFAGEDFTAADVLMSFPVEAGATRSSDKPRPALAAFLERIHARPAYRRALERGGPYGMLR